MSEPKRHHYVPKFYLRRFADRKDRLRVYPRGIGAPFTTRVINAAVESGFYTITLASGEQSVEVEEFLSRVERDAAGAIERLVKGHFPLSEQDRQTISYFVALQMTRTREQRHSMEMVADSMHKGLIQRWNEKTVWSRLKELGIEPTDEAVGEVMDIVRNPDRYRIVPHVNESIWMMLRLAVNAIAPVIEAKSWILARTRDAHFVTGDHPIVYHSRPDPSGIPMGIGLATADEVYFPVDRNHVLLLAQPNTLPEIKIDVTSENVLYVNHLICQASYEWIYQHLDDSLLKEILPTEKKPLMEVNGKPVYRT